MLTDKDINILMTLWTISVMLVVVGTAIGMIFQNLLDVMFWMIISGAICMIVSFIRLLKIASAYYKD